MRRPSAPTIQVTSANENGLPSWERARATLGRYPDAALLAALLLLTATLSRSFSQVSVGPVYVTEVVMGVAGLIAIRRLGLRGSWRTLRERLPLIALGVIWLLGVIATVRGLRDYSLSLVSEDIGLVDYSLLLPLLALVVYDRARHETLFGVLVACGFAGMATFAVAYTAAQVTGEPDALITLQGSAAGLYTSLAVSWICARVAHGVPTPRWLIALAPVGLVLMFLTSQRSVWMMAILALAAIAVLAPQPRRRRAVLAAAAVVPVAFALAIGVQQVLVETVEPVKGSTSNFAVTSYDNDAGVEVQPTPAPAPAPTAAAPEPQPQPEATAPAVAPEPVPASLVAPPAPAPPPLPAPVDAAAPAPVAGGAADTGPQLARELTNLGGTGTGESQNVGWRLDYWRELLGRVPEDPVLGVGFGEPARFVRDGLKYDFRDGDPYASLDVAGPHNGFVSFVYRMGIPALLALLWVIGVGWRTVRDALREGQATGDRVALVTLVAMFAAGLMACSFNEGLTGPFLGMFFWVPLAMILIWPGTRGREAEAA